MRSTLNNTELLGVIRSKINSNFLELYNSKLITVRDFGAVGNGVTDDTLAIQSAIDYVTINGGVLVFLQGSYLISPQGSNTYCLKITKGIRTYGLDATLIIADTTTNLKDGILIEPSGYNIFGGIENLAIIPQSIGGGCRYAIHISIPEDAINNKYLDKYLISRIYTDNFNSNTISLKLTNLNNNDGFFGSVIQDCSLTGGILLSGLGDSNQILRNKIYGYNRGIDIVANIGTGIGVIEDNNIVSRGGAIRLNNAMQYKIYRNQIEQHIAFTGLDADNGQIILIDSTMCDVQNNNVNAFLGGTLNIKHNIISRGGKWNQFDRNYLTKGTDECISLESGANNKIYGGNIFADGEAEVFIEPSVRIGTATGTYIETLI